MWQYEEIIDSHASLLPAYKEIGTHCVFSGVGKISASPYTAEVDVKTNFLESVFFIHSNNL